MFVVTYCVQSITQGNDPLVVNEVFKLKIPRLALLSDTAKIWIHAYWVQPVDDFHKIAKGL